MESTIVNHKEKTMKIKIIQFLKSIDQLQDGLTGEQLCQLLKILKIDPLQVIYKPESFEKKGGEQ